MDVRDIRQCLEQRLAERTVPMPAIAAVDSLHLHISGLPDWWLANGNVLYTTGPEARLPHLGLHWGLPPPTGAVVVLGCVAMAASITLWGEAPLILLGGGTSMAGARIACGGRSTIVVGDRTASNGQAAIDARNGGIVAIGEDGLWAPGVHLFSDDMHAVRHVGTGARWNAFGGTVVVQRHVWLGNDALLLGGAQVGADSVVGARAVVKRASPSNAVIAGVPARVVKRDVTWSFDDLP